MIIESLNPGAATSPEPSQPAETSRPMVVVDLGKTSAKKIRQLKKGKGKLIDEVNDALELAGANSLTDKQLVPIVFVYRQKKKKLLGSLL